MERKSKKKSLQTACLKKETLPATLSGENVLGLLKMRRFWPHLFTGIPPDKIWDDDDDRSVRGCNQSWAESEITDSESASIPKTLNPD